MLVILLLFLFLVWPFSTMLEYGDQWNKLECRFSHHLLDLEIKEMRPIEIENFFVFWNETLRPATYETDFDRYISVKCARHHGKGKRDPWCYCFSVARLFRGLSAVCLLCEVSSERLTFWPKVLTSQMNSDSDGQRKHDRPIICRHFFVFVCLNAAPHQITAISL